MLEIVIPEQHYEFFNEITEEFLPSVDIKETRLQLEHSLVSLRKWEEKWHKPFLGKQEKAYDELIDYIKCMTLTQNVDDEVYKWIPKNVVEEVVKYIENPMTATWFSGDAFPGAQKTSRETITAEIIYYWMVTLSIPMEFEERHLNQLFTLIKVINVKSQKPKKVDPVKAAQERDALNKRRREQLKSNG